MATHRHWRLNILDSARDYAGFAEIELRDSAGGADLTGSGTASVSSNYGGAAYDASKAVDNNTATLWAVNFNSYPQWWAYDFGSGNAYEIVEIVIVPRQDAYYGDAPSSFEAQYSDNGTDWTTYKSVTYTWLDTNQQIFGLSFNPAPLGDTLSLSDEVNAILTPVNAPSTSYSNPLGSGQRTGAVIVTNTCSFNGTIYFLVNGNATNPTYFNSAAISGTYIRFQFPGAVVISEFHYLQDSVSQGIWQIQGSNDGTNWDNLGGTFTLGVSNNQYITTPSQSITPYLYYQLLGISGSSSSIGYVYQFEFKIAAQGTDPSYISLYGSGDRSAIITVSSTAGYFSGTGQSLVDGNFNSIYVAGGAVTGKYLKFDFGASPQKITEAWWWQSVDDVLGTWQWQGSVDDTNWVDIGSPFAIDTAYQRFTELNGNSSAYRYYRLLGISGSASSAPFLYEIQFKTITSLNPGVAVADSLNNWQDYVTNKKEIPTGIIDNIYHFYDEVIIQLWVYFNQQTVIVADSFTAFDDSLDALALLFEGVDITFELGDANRLSDSIEIVEHLFISIEDSVNNLSDEVVLMPGEFVDYAYDTMMYDFLDSIQVDLRQHRDNAESFTLSDTVSVSLVVFLMSLSITGDVFTLSDAINSTSRSNREVSDDLNLYDSIQLFMTTVRSISDSFTLSDSVQVSLSSQEISPTESLALWQDLVFAELQIKLSLNVSDALSLSDAIVNSGVEEDLTYYRRYLNDVIR